MKRPKKPTRVQKIIIYNNNLNSKTWMVEKEDESYLYLISRTGKQKRCINKFAKKRDKITKRTSMK